MLKIRHRYVVVLESALQLVDLIVVLVMDGTDFLALRLNLLLHPPNDVFGLFDLVSLGFNKLIELQVLLVVLGQEFPDLF